MKTLPEAVRTSRELDYSPFVTDPKRTSPFELAKRSGAAAVQNMLQNYVNYGAEAAEVVSAQEMPDGQAS